MDEVLVHERLVDDVFATACMVTVAPDRRAAVLRVAGHPLPVLLAGGTATELPGPSSRPLLGIGARATGWAGMALELPDRWELLLYTDGLIEGRTGVNGARLGSERLVDLVRERADTRASESGQALIERLIATARELNGEELTDDVAVLLLTVGADG
jgi:serine phosphatase RsbU (regulator of sigma subunit)